MGKHFLSLPGLSLKGSYRESLMAQGEGGGVVVGGEGKKKERKKGGKRRRGDRSIRLVNNNVTLQKKS